MHYWHKWLRGKASGSIFSKTTYQVLKYRVEAIYNLGFQKDKNKLVSPFVQSKEPFTGITGKKKSQYPHIHLRFIQLVVWSYAKRPKCKSSPSDSTEAGHFPEKEEFAASKFQWILLKVEQYYKEKRKLAIFCNFQKLQNKAKWHSLMLLNFSLVVSPETEKAVIKTCYRK